VEASICGIEARDFPAFRQPQTGSPIVLLMIYASLTILSLLILLFLTLKWEPLLPRWLARRLEREAAAQLPLTLSIERLELHLRSKQLILHTVTAKGQNNECIVLNQIVIDDPLAYLWQGAILSVTVAGGQVDKPLQWREIFESQEPGELRAWQLFGTDLLIETPDPARFQGFGPISVDFLSLAGDSAGVSLEELKANWGEQGDLLLNKDIGGSGQSQVEGRFERDLCIALLEKYEMPWRPAFAGGLIGRGRIELGQRDLQVHQLALQWGGLSCELSGSGSLEGPSLSVRLSTELDLSGLKQITAGFEQAGDVDELLDRLSPDSPMSLSGSFRWSAGKGDLSAHLRQNESVMKITGFEEGELLWPLKLAGSLAPRSLLPLLKLDSDQFQSGSDKLDLQLSLTHNQGWTGSGEAALGSLLLRIPTEETSFIAYPLSDLSATFTFDPREFAWHDFSATFLGGRLLKGDGRVDLASPLRPYGGTIDYQDLSIEDWPTGPEGANPGLSQVLEGQATGWFEFQGDLRPESFTGEGQLTVEDPNYTFLKDIRERARSLSLPLPHQRGVKAATGMMILEDGGFRLEDISAPLVGVKIEGHWGFDKSQKVDSLFKIDVARTFLSKSPLLILPVFMTGSLDFEVKGSGTLSDPNFHADLKILDKLMGKGAGEEGFLPRLLRGFD
jgi:hypothetical protein